MGKPEQVALALTAGALSAVLYAGVLGGGAFGTVFPVHFTSLPLLFACVGLGSVPFAVACATGVLGVAVGSGAGMLGLLVYAGVHVLPVGLVHARLTWAGPVTDASGPTGRLVSELALLAAVTMLIVYAVVDFDPFRLSGGLAESFGGLLATAVPDLPTEARTVMVEDLVRYFPGFVAVWWLLTMVICAVLAQAAARRFGMARFPTPRYRSFRVPMWMVGLFLLALLPAALMEGDVAAVTGAFALLLGIPLLLQGLAVVHTVSRSWPGRRLLLFACYGSLVWPFAPLAWAFITALGVTEQYNRLRRPHPVRE